MKKITLIALMLFTALGYAQVGINTNTPDASSALEIESTTGGILIPRLTETQRDAITAPATGLMIYQTNQTTGFYFYDGAVWTKINGVAGPQGEAGSQGIQGIQGDIGLTGAPGPSGANGANGSVGAPGPEGQTGLQGIQGLQGDIGLTGATGPPGANGSAGIQGPQGEAGPQGEPASVMDQGYVNGVNCTIPGATAYNSDVGANVVCNPYLIIDGTEQFLITNELTCADNSEGTSTNIEYWISFEVSQPLITYLLTFIAFANNSFCGNTSGSFREIYKVESSLFNSGTNLGEMIFSGTVGIPRIVLNPGNTYTIRVAGFDSQVSRTTSVSNYSVNSNLFSNVKFYTTTPNSVVLNETFDQWALLYNFGNSFLDGNILTVFSNWELRWQDL